ncbi:MAG: uroporphyrinogen-III synthase [Methylovirgula sp.]
MFVLLTRPLDEAMHTAENLAALGHTAVLSPVIDIVPTGASWPHGVIDAVVATSARAFQCFDIAPDWPPAEARRLYPLFVVGARTAEAARARGFEGVPRITLDAKALCSVILERFEPGAHLVYLAGRDRKSDLETYCRKAGVTLDAVETYAAQSAPHLSDEAVRLADEGVIGAVLHFSRRSAEIFLRLAAEARFDPAPLIHVVISADVAEPLAALPKVVIVQEPTEDAILALFRSPPAART